MSLPAVFLPDALLDVPKLSGCLGWLCLPASRSALGSWFSAGLAAGAGRPSGDTGALLSPEKPVIGDAAGLGEVPANPEVAAERDGLNRFSVPPRAEAALTGAPSLMPVAITVMEQVSAGSAS